MDRAFFHLFLHHYPSTILDLLSSAARMVALTGECQKGDTLRHFGFAFVTAAAFALAAQASFAATVDASAPQATATPAPPSTVAAAPTPVSTTPASVSATSAPASGIAATDPNAIVCKRLAPETGTRLGSRTQCRTNAQWDEITRDAQQGVRAQQQRSGATFADKPG